MAMAPSEPDWAGLPQHLLDLIYDKLDSLSHTVQFGAVCLSWQSIAMHNQNQLHNKTSIPLLMIPTKDNSEKKRSLYSVTEGKICDFQLSVPYNMRCCGSSYGCLVVFTKTIAPILFNPFRNSTKAIHLPRLKIKPRMSAKCFHLEIAKLVLSADPYMEEDYVVASIYGAFGRLACKKAGDQSWTYIDKDLQPFEDVIFYRGRILAVTHTQKVVSVDVYSNQQVKIISQGTGITTYGHAYLVESLAGDLLMVQKYFYRVYDGMPEDLYEKYNLLTETFIVYKLVLDDQTGMVVDKIEVKSLGEEALFLGDNSSMSILASKYHGLEHNSIYYTDDYATWPHLGPRDIGMFSLKDRSIHQHYVVNPSQEHMPRPIWIVPTLEGRIRM